MASALAVELGLDVDGLRALRLPTDLLPAFPHWRAGSTRGFRPRPLGVRLAPDAVATPIRGLRLHVSPSAAPVPLAFSLLKELRRRLDPSVRLVVLVDPAADADALRRAASRALGTTTRVTFVSSDFNTVFARDNALAARDAEGRAVLVVPRRVRGADAIESDPLDRRRIEERLGIRVVTSRLHWQGGNILYDGSALVVGADTIAENVTRLGLTADEVSRWFAAEFGLAVTVLGDVSAGRLDEERNRLDPSGQASYHVDLDVALLGRRRGSERPVALVGDGRRGLEHLREVLAHLPVTQTSYLSAAAARRKMADEYRAAAKHREPRLREYRETLEKHGYRTVGVPELRTRDLTENEAGLRDFVYCNVLPGVNRQRPAVHFLPWGIRGLDLAAESAYRRAGVFPVRVSRTPYLAIAMMERAAGLRCFCGAMP